MRRFTTLTDDNISGLIFEARKRILMAAPGVSEQVADALARRSSDIPVKVVIDPDPGMCRLGYGAGKGMAELSRSNLDLRRAPGLRIGALLIDDGAWIFAPAPLIAVEPIQEGTINAICAHPAQVEALLDSLVPEDMSRNREPAAFEQSASIEGPDIGQETLSETEVQAVVHDLEARPPKRFDLIRQTLVYNAEVQFVELKVRGAQIERKTIPVPESLLGISDDPEFRGRLKSSFSLITGDSGLSSRHIDRKRREIEKVFVRKLGPRFGNVILLKQKENFTRKIEELENELDEFRQDVETVLEQEIKRSKEFLASTLAPIVEQSPPSELLGQISRSKPDRETADAFVRYELDQAFPEARSLITNMRLDCFFKDVTFEMLNDLDFQEAVRAHFPFEFPQRAPYRQRTVAPERERVVE